MSDVQQTPPPAPLVHTPPAYAAPVAAPARRRNVLGIIALAVAALGFVFACIPGFLIMGWVLLPVGFILGIVAVCLSGRTKWQGLTAIIVAVVGTIVGIIVFVAVVAVSVGEAVGSAGEVEVGASTSEVAEPAEAAAAEQGTRENPLALATPISNDEWDVTLTAIDTNAGAAVAAAWEYNDAAPAGQRYVIVDATATYKGADEGTSMMVEIDYVAADGTIVSSWDNMVIGVDPQFGQANLYAGASDTGKLVFLVPDAPGGLIRVQPGLMSDDVFFAVP